MITRNNDSIMRDLLALLNGCADLARTLSQDTAGVLPALEQLIAKIEAHQGNLEADDLIPGLVNGATIRAIQTDPGSARLYLVLLPPDSGPNFEDCPTCFGKRIQGTNKQ
ncbi:hypothetical protein ELI49_30250 (plasmid) [Rhizobium ruizarguesonis]|uniref:hypothetical protein n=1 Tax=Rhizobium ruizarguesonis TaxID=2081791 RepID=UPI000374F07B|nr:hypothetical protein [Rhizobium ruizarguesonis]TAT97607.1 hypothetical protein ELI49_30250 [Rhizobium ruizarguesonis]